METFTSHPVETWQGILAELDYLFQVFTHSSPEHVQGNKVMQGQ
jgi:hypothetical protein